MNVIPKSVIARRNRRFYLEVFRSQVSLLAHLVDSTSKLHHEARLVLDHSSHEHQQAAYNMQNSIQGARNVPGLNLGGGMVDGKLGHSRSNSRSSLGLAAAKNFF